MLYSEFSSKKLPSILMSLTNPNTQALLEERGSMRA
jgi:hypothetical protein